MFWAAEHFRRGPTVLIEQRFMARLKGHVEDESLVGEALRAINRYTSVLDEHLRTRQFVVGDALTLADFDLAAPLSHIPRTQAPFLEYPHVAAWYVRVNNIVAWQATGLDQERRIREIERFFSPAQ
jgi:glutathione S-transferase